MNRLTLATLLVALALSLGSGWSRAQQPGDVYWQFVPNGLMADDRIESALVLLLDADTVAQSAGLEGELLYGDPATAEFVAGVDEDEARMLLTAAGVGVPAEGVVQVRPCRFWTPPEGELLEKRGNVGMALGEALAKVLFDIGIATDADPSQPAQPLGAAGALCEPTTDREAADILIWEYGQDYATPEGVYYPNADSFLALDFTLPGGGTGGNDVSPPVTGDGGLR